MKIKIDGAVMGATIKTMQKMVQAQQVTVTVRKGELGVIGVGNGNSFSMSCPCKVTEKSDYRSFTVGVENLVNAINKKGEIEIEIEEAAVKVRAARYEAELLTQPSEEVIVIPEEVKTGKGGIKIKDKFLNKIREHLAKLELKPLLALYDYIPFGIKSTDKGTFVACFDEFQAAFYFDKELTGDLELTLPSNVFTLLARELKGQDYKMVLTDSTVYAYNDIFELALARPQTDGQGLTMDSMLQLYDTIKKDYKKNSSKIVLKKEGIMSMTENAKAVYEKDSTFTFSTKGNKCKLELKSSYGKIQSMVLLDEHPKKDLTFSCDFNFFSTLLAKASPTVELHVTDRMMLFRNNPVTYLLSLV